MSGKTVQKSGLFFEHDYLFHLLLFLIYVYCDNHNERIIGKLENESEYGSWNFQIKILKLNKITATILYNSQKLTPSGLWDNGIQKSQKFTKDITNHSSIEEFIQSVIRYIQGKDYKVKNWTIK